MSRRTSVKATIKRASQRARARANRLDAESLQDLRLIYQRAAGELRDRIEAYGDRSDGTIRLQSLRQVQADIDGVLAELNRVQRTALFERMQQVAAMGIEPVAEMLGAQRTAELVDSAVKAVRDFVAEDGLQLSDRLWRIENSAREVVGQSISNAVIQGHSASQAAQEFLARGEPVPGYLQQKISGANAARLGRVAGESLLNSDDNAYENARRVFRTEINRAHGTAYQSGVFEHPDVVGTRFLLSPGHPEPDICDMHAKINAHGLGPGVYPKGRSPWPAHPNTLSYEEAVFADEVAPQFRGTKEDPVDWIGTQPMATQINILGGARKQRALETGLLKRSEISTPWYVLKKKYQKAGVNLDDLKPLRTGNTEPERRPIPPGQLDFGKASGQFNDLARRAFDEAPEVVKAAIRATPKINEFHLVTGRAYCSRDGITLDREDLLPGREAWADDVTRHEYGHWIDFNGRHKGLDRKGVFLSSTPNAKGGLGDSMRKAMNNLNDLPFSDLIEIMKELRSRRDVVLADLFGALTLNKVGWGHDKAYYRRVGFQETEAFANLTCLYARKDKTGWNFAASYMPDLCDRFLEVISKLGAGES